MKKEEFLSKPNWFNKHIIGEFRNEFGEIYFVAKHFNSYWIAGSETDWEVLQIHESLRFAHEPFIFSDDEKQKLEEILRNETEQKKDK